MIARTGGERNGKTAKADAEHVPEVGFERVGRHRRSSCRAAGGTGAPVGPHSAARRRNVKGERG